MPSNTKKGVGFFSRLLKAHNFELRLEIVSKRKLKLARIA